MLAVKDALQNFGIETQELDDPSAILDGGDIIFTGEQPTPTSPLPHPCTDELKLKEEVKKKKKKGPNLLRKWVLYTAFSVYMRYMYVHLYCTNVQVNN